MNSELMLLMGWGLAPVIVALAAAFYGDLQGGASGGTLRPALAVTALILAVTAAALTGVSISLLATGHEVSAYVVAWGVYGLALGTLLTVLGYVAAIAALKRRRRRKRNKAIRRSERV